MRQPARPLAGLSATATLILPLLAVAAVLAILLLADPLRTLTGSAPPVEELKIESVTMDPGMIRLHVRADGSEPVRIAQVQVDGAYRTFSINPEGAIPRLGTARLDIPYPWVEGEAHHVVVITGTGATFDHTIEVATLTPRIGGSELAVLAFVGLVLGLAPVSAGLMFYPAMRSFGPALMEFALALTVGLLVYLLIDTMGEGFELAGEAVDRLRAHSLIIVSAAITFAALIAIGRREGRPPHGIMLAFFIALGIGLHNLGEGLVVGAALSTGAAALATFLLVGFVIHNVSEGFGIAAPMVGERPRWYVFVGLAAVAGLPALAGVIFGAQAVSPYWAALCFGIGAGAIAQVVFEVTALIARRSGADAFGRPAVLGGFVAGLAIMYATALLV